MYQGIMATNHGPPSYEAGFLHNAASGASPVYVPTTRVTPMIPSLPYLQPHGASQQGGPVSGHSAWAQPGADSSSGTPYSSASGARHASPASSRFAYSTSPPVGSGGVGRETASSYASPLNISAGGREHYGTRGLGGSYHSPYPAYINPSLGGTWPSSPFDSSVLHGLQGAGQSATRHPNLGKKSECECCYTAFRFVIGLPLKIKFLWTFYFNISGTFCFNNKEPARLFKLLSSELFCHRNSYFEIPGKLWVYLMKRQAYHENIK